MSRTASSRQCTVAEARREIVARAAPLGGERVPLARARGRLLRVSVHATEDSPPFAASAMDGFAARRADLDGPLRLIGEARAGAGCDRSVGAGECVRIFTGAAVPAGADCVVPQENADRRGGTVRLRRSSRSDYIRRRGENFRVGARLLSAGTRLGALELAALAASGVTHPEVARAPRCFHLVLGGELVAPGAKVAGAQIRDTNSTLVAALLAQHGAVRAGHRRMPDDFTAARDELLSAPDYDVLLISGGAGRGDHDLARPLLHVLGYKVHFEEVNLRPGKPLLFATRGRRLAFALPGNPVSHWVVFQLFVGPLLARLQGRAGAGSTLSVGQLAPGAVLPEASSRHTYWPSRVERGHGLPAVSPLALSSSGDVCGLVGANALLPLRRGDPDSSKPVRFICCP